MNRLGLLTVLVVLGVLAGGGAAQGTPTELFISEYIEGSSNNKAIEIFNGTGAPVNLATGGYQLVMYFNGSSTIGLTIPLTGSVSNGDVYVVAQSSANATILAQADQTNGAGWFNGDDAVALLKGGVGGALIDVIGQVGFDPGTEWGSGLTSTMDNTLRRKSAIEAGDPIGTNVFDPSVEWDGFANDTFDGLGFHSSDAPPSVTTTTPSNGAGDVAVNANVDITFSEPVNVTGTWFDISCDTSGNHTATVSGGPTMFTLNPDTDFVLNESCTVTVQAGGVTDQDAIDPPDNMTANHAFSFATPLAITLIHDIQGPGLASPVDGLVRKIEGVVVGDFQGSAGLNGFFVQEEDADADANSATSEGIFVFAPGAPAVAVGDRVQVQGTVDEFFGLTELTSVTSVAFQSTGNTPPTASTVALPVATLDDFEPSEGMRATFPQTLTATETFTLGRFGEVALSSPERLFTPTQLVAPGAPAIARQDLNNRSRILLDDGSNVQNPAVVPYIAADGTLRIGDAVDDLSGVLTFAFNTYRIEPTGAVAFERDNPRPTGPPDVGGSLRVGSANVLNYFTTLANAGPVCGPLANQDCRGANNATEFARQRVKLVAALTRLNADVLGLTELENHPGNVPIADLVAGLNAATAPGTYAFIATGAVGTDAIRVGIVYKPSQVTPVGSFAVLDSSVDPTFIDTRNRPVIAQTFQENGTDDLLTVAANHLKSKGSGCADIGNPDIFDGQGNCNLTRKAAAEALVDWLATDPTGSGSDDSLIIGDLNSYAQEDPIKAIEAGGYTNLVGQFVGEESWSFVFQAQSGTLDYALANPSLASRVTGAGEYHINADEPIFLDYNTEFNPPSAFVPNEFRSADHDPLLVGVCEATPPELDVSVSPSSLWPPNHKYRNVTATVDVSDGVDPDPLLVLVSVTSNEPDNGADDGNTVNDIVVVDDFHFQLRAERSEVGTGREYTITYKATDACGNETTATATVTVPISQ